MYSAMRYAKCNIIKHNKPTTLTPFQVLEARGSSNVPSLLVEAALRVSTKARDRALSMSSASSSKRMAAMTESNFKDWGKRSTEVSIREKGLKNRFNKNSIMKCIIQKSEQSL